MRDTRAEYLEEEKLRAFDEILDIFLDRDMNYQTRMSKINDILMYYAAWRRDEK